MSAKLPRLMVYANAIRGRIRNRSLDLHAVDGGDYYVTFRSVGPPPDGPVAMEWRTKAVNHVRIRLSAEAIEALRQVLNQNTLTPIQRHEDH